MEIKVPILKSNEISMNGNKYHIQALQDWFNSFPAHASLPINIQKNTHEMHTVVYLHKNNFKIEDDTLYVLFKDNLPTEIQGRFLVPNIRVNSSRSGVYTDPKVKYSDRNKVTYSEVFDITIISLQASLEPSGFKSLQDARMVQPEKEV